MRQSPAAAAAAGIPMVAAHQAPPPFGVMGTAPRFRWQPTDLLGLQPGLAAAAGLAGVAAGGSAPIAAATAVPQANIDLSAALAATATAAAAAPTALAATPTSVAALPAGAIPGLLPSALNIPTSASPMGMTSPMTLAAFPATQQVNNNSGLLAAAAAAAVNNPYLAAQAQQQQQQQQQQQHQQQIQLANLLASAGSQAPQMNHPLLATPNAAGLTPQGGIVFLPRLP